MPEKKGCFMKLIIKNSSLCIKRHPVIFLTIVSSLIFFPLLGSYPLLGQWEPHYGRVAMDMLANNSWDFFIDPVYLENDNFWSKPILCLWMVLPFVRLFGNSEWALRIPFAINGVAGIILVWYTVRRIFRDNTRAIISATILIFMPYYYLITRQFMWDITLITLMYGAVTFLFMGIRENSVKFLRLAYVFIGLGILTKGLLAIAIPGGIFFTWMIITTDYSKNDNSDSYISSTFKKYLIFIKKARVFEGIIIFLLIGAPWYIYMTAKHGMPFLNEFFGQHHFGRLVGNIDKPSGTFEFYFWQTGLGLFPWIGLLVPALYFTAMEKKNRTEELFFIISFMFIFLFFTLSVTKFPHYTAPVAPFAAIIISIPIIRFFSGRRRILYPLTAITTALLIGIIGKDLGTGMNYREILYIITTHRLQDWFGRVYDMRPWLQAIVPLMIIFIMLPMINIKKLFLMKTGLIGFFITSVFFAGYINFYFIPQVLHVFSPKQLVKEYKENKKTGDIAVGYENWKNRSMFFYLGLDEKYHRTRNVDHIISIIKNNPEKNIYIFIKKDEVSKLRQKTISELAIPIEKIADDRVQSYMEIELYKTSMKNSGKMDDSWKENIITDKELPKNLKNISGTLGDGKIRVLGYTLNKQRFDPGEKLRLDVFYKVLEEPEKGWKMFFHFDVYSGALPHSFKNDIYPLKGFHPTNHWKKGEIIRQTIEKAVPKKHPGGGVKIYTGFYIGKKRMDVDQNKYNDGSDRFILGTFRVNIR
ncbi:MAG: glycosyltransferase family 39 protein [bacterium]